MTTTLITGANKGLGREAARRLKEAGHTVWVGARDPERGRRTADELGTRFVQLDVTDQESVDAAADTLLAAVGGIDVLVNNAGIPGGFPPLAKVTADEMRRIYETNVFGLVRVMQAFLPQLEKSRAAVVVNVSSGMGSLGMTNDPQRLESTKVALSYPSSKSAVNMLTSMYAKACPDMTINAVDPGYTATDFNDHRGTKPVEQGAEIIVRAAQFGDGDPTGSFLNEAGPIPW